MAEHLGEVSAHLVAYVLAYVEREATPEALAAWPLRNGIHDLRISEPERWIGAARFGALLANAAELLGRPDTPERIGRAVPELLAGGVIGTLLGSVSTPSDAYRALPRVVGAVDSTTALEVRDVGARSATVVLHDTGGTPPPVAAFWRGVVGVLPVYLGRPPATVRPLPDTTEGLATPLVVTWLSENRRPAPAVGLAAGSLVGASVFALAASPELAELLSVPLRAAGGLAFAALGLLLGIRHHLARELERRHALVRRQNEALRQQTTALHAAGEHLLDTRRQLDTEVRDRTAALERERERVRRLLGLAGELTATLDLTKLLDLALARIPTMLGGQAGVVHLLDLERGTLERAAESPPGLDDCPASVPLGPVVEEPRGTLAPLLRLAVREERSLLVPETTDPSGAPQGSTGMIVILRSGGVVGTLTVLAPTTGRAFEEDAFHLASLVAEHLSTAVANAILMQRLRILSVTDGLTGLYLHRYFQESLERESERARRYASPLSLILLDIDEFKGLNDRYGHLTGDAILAEIARILREELRAADTPARYGGDELVAILPQTSIAGARALAERIRAKVRSTRILRNEVPVPVSVSIGVAEFHPSMSRTALVDAADRALYRAKAGGRDRVEAHALAPVAVGQPYSAMRRK